MRKHRLRPTPAGVIACLALAIALGGTAFAATALVPKNSVGSPQVINGSLKTKDLSRNARIALKGSRGPRGFTGPRGAQGAQGAQGVQGAQGIQGPIGPSEGYEAIFCSAPGCPGSSNPAQEITEPTLATAPFFATINNLPAGDYTVTGQVTIVAAATSDWRVICQLRVPLSGHGWAGGATATVGDDVGDATEVSLPMVFGARLVTAGSTLGLNCARSGGAGGGNPSVTYADFIATRVGTMH